MGQGVTKSNTCSALKVQRTHGAASLPANTVLQCINCVVQGEKPTSTKSLLKKCLKNLCNMENTIEYYILVI